MTAASRSVISTSRVVISQHARERAKERGVTTQVLSRLISRPRLFIEKSKTDPVSGRRVLREDSLLIVWTFGKNNEILILSVFVDKDS
ncbi:MAG: DUF4258 domain-containing protein [Hyphomicrobiales bacterium]|nr:DUF4258 domain-containing protein [Hyphomicrobiales bacterium]MBV9521111.1 DUF4258 domain-containing protein [Hyphomicrobiales bacterium]